MLADGLTVRAPPPRGRGGERMNWSPNTYNRVAPNTQGGNSKSPTVFPVALYNERLQDVVATGKTIMDEAGIKMNMIIEPAMFSIATSIATSKPVSDGIGGSRNIGLSP